MAAVYSIGILDFVFDEDRKADDHEVVHTVQLKNQNGAVFYDKLTFIYLTLPHFHKTGTELTSLQDKWFYVFRHLHELTEIHPALQERIFKKLFEVARIAKFRPEEQKSYEDSLKYYRDLKNVTDTAWDEGKAAGLAEGKMTEKKAIARQLLERLDDKAISQSTGLPLSVIKQLRNER